MSRVKQQIGKATTVHNCAVSCLLQHAERPVADHIQVIVTTQMATKLLTAEGKRVNFDTGDKAVLMPQLGQSVSQSSNNLPVIRSDSLDEMWQTAKTLRIALFRGPDGNEVRYAHVGTASSDDDGTGEWACLDIDVSKP